MQKVHREARRQRKPHKWDTHHACLADKYAAVVECRAVLDDAPGFEPSKTASCFIEVALRFSHDHDAVARREHEICIGHHVMMVLANHRDLYTCRQVAANLVQCASREILA